MNNNRALAHSLFKERHQFREDHQHVSCIKEANKEFFLEGGGSTSEYHLIFMTTF